MAKKALSELSVEELESKLKAAKTIQIIFICIFTVIILAWVALGFWRKNLPAFISTVTMAIAFNFILRISFNNLASELRKRGQDKE